MNRSSTTSSPKQAQADRRCKRQAPPISPLEFSGLSPGTYSFTVVARGKTDNGDPGHSNKAIIKPPQPCSLPAASAQAVLNGQSVAVNWTAPADTDSCPAVTTDLTGYTVNVVSGPTQPSKSTTSTSTTYDNLATGSYVFSVVANYSGGLQSVAAVATPNPVVVGCSVKPPSPPDVSAMGGVNSATVTWTNAQVPNCTVSYVVTTTGLTQPDAPNPDAIPDLAAGSYTFSVVAKDAAGVSLAATSNQVMVTNPCPPASPLPPQVSAPVESTTTAGSVTVNWEAPANALACPTPASYVVTVDGKTTPSGPLSADLEGLDPAVQHSVTVAAVYAAPYSTSVSSATLTFNAPALCPNGSISALQADCPSTTGPNLPPPS